MVETIGSRTLFANIMDRRPLAKVLLVDDEPFSCEAMKGLI